MRRKYVYACLAGLALVSMACGGLGAAATSGGSGTSGISSYNTKFPLPSSVSNFTSTGEDSVNFQTKLSLADAITFYRDEFGKQGLTERSILTSITDTTFSLVFDGDPSGKALVVQGVDLGNGSTNVNIRYEDV